MPREMNQPVLDSSGPLHRFTSETLVEPDQAPWNGTTCDGRVRIL